MKTYEQTVELVKQWATERGIFPVKSLDKQMLVLTMECSELIEAVIKDKGDKEIKSEIGDVLVSISLLALQYGVNPTECINIAYNKISQRKGVTKDGFFKKDKGQH